MVCKEIALYKVILVVNVYCASLLCYSDGIVS